jgi:hypothetical protein
VRTHDPRHLAIIRAVSAETDIAVYVTRKKAQCMFPAVAFGFHTVRFKINNTIVLFLSRRSCNYVDRLISFGNGDLNEVKFIP